MTLSAQELNAYDFIFPDGLYCHQCGYRDIVYESDSEGYRCLDCGANHCDEEVKSTWD